MPDKKDIEITIIATGFVDKNAAPARGVGSAPLHTAKPVAAAIADAAGSKKDEETAEAEKAEFNRDIFANRPVFNVRPTAPAEKEEAPAEPVRPVRPEPVEPQSGLQSGRIDIGSAGRQVPPFLRHLRKGRD